MPLSNMVKVMTCRRLRWSLVQFIMRGKQCLLNYEGKHGSEQPHRRTESAIRLARMGAGWQTSGRALCIKLFSHLPDYQEVRNARFDVLDEGGH